MTIQADVFQVGDVEIRSGSGDPTTGLAAPVGSLYLRDIGTIYQKTGAGNSDWEELGAGGSLRFIDNQKVSGGATTAVSFFNLDGDSDQAYCIMGRGQLLNGSAELVLKPNGVSTDQASRLEHLDYQSFAGSRAVVTKSSLPLCGGDGAYTENGFFFFEAMLWARSGIPRGFRADNMHFETTNRIWSRFTKGFWLNTADNITSLTMSAPSLSIAEGSEFFLYKVTSP